MSITSLKLRNLPISCLNWFSKCGGFENKMPFACLSDYFQWSTMMCRIWSWVPVHILLYYNLNPWQAISALTVLNPVTWSYLTKSTVVPVLAPWYILSIHYTVSCFIGLLYQAVLLSLFENSVSSKVEQFTTTE